MEQTGSRNDYRNWLGAELKRRQRVNPSYSLRGFALALELSPSFLSKVLAGKKNLSPQKAVQVAEQLQLSDAERSHFIRWVQEQSAGESVREALEWQPESEGRAESAARLELDSFQVISDWHHYALRELVETRGFRAEPVWIAARLGIRSEEASDALERLIRLGMIRREGGKWRKADALVFTPSGTPSSALRHHHSQMIQKAREALESQPVSERDITGITIPTDPARVDAVREEIKRFRRRMTKLLESSRPSEVYQLNIQLFRLTEAESPRASRGSRAVRALKEGKC